MKYRDNSYFSYFVCLNLYFFFLIRLMKRCFLTWDAQWGKEIMLARFETATLSFPFQAGQRLFTSENPVMSVIVVIAYKSFLLAIVVLAYLSHY